MEKARSGPYLALRLDHGEDILEAIGEATEAEEGTLLVVAGLGMISDFELGYFDNGVYISKPYQGAHELLSMQGSVASTGTPRIHVHVTVADKEHKAFGGHLMRGKVWMSNEIALLRLSDVRSSRKVDPVKKVGVLHFEEQS